MSFPTPRMTVVADDLSGAQECIATVTRLGVSGTQLPLQSASSAATVLLSPERPLPETQILAIDTNSRALSPAEAAAHCTAALEKIHDRLGVGDTLFLKFDSVIRGPIAAQLRAAAKLVGPLVFCPAVPDLNRVLCDGVVNVNGVALHETGLWHLEPEFAPESVFDLFGELYTTKITLAQVRSGQLDEILRGTSPETQVIVCDAETAEDLDRIANAAITTGLALAGASGLCAALARTQPSTGSTEQFSLSHRDKGILYVIGTASRQADIQVTRLARQNIPVLQWNPGDEITLPAGDCVVTVAGPIRPAEAHEINVGLTQLITQQHRNRDLFLTGGQTARNILDALGIPRLTPITQPEFGTVVSLAEDGRLIATRPGSFGSPGSLSHTHHTLKHLRALSERILP